MTKLVHRIPAILLRPLSGRSWENQIPALIADGGRRRGSRLRS
ncbi:hypothetical protein L083_1409 [Actinoplanes sp. N902-109]|nr:hypothetical protein L083_1409 [Actinoplanes sp. N902-109]